MHRLRPVLQFSLQGAATLLLLACSPSRGSDGTPSDHVSVKEQDPPARPGKQYVPQLGAYVPVLVGHTMDIKATEVMFLADDRRSGFSLNWESDPDALFQRFVHGIPIGDKTVMTNGQTEDWGCKLSRSSAIHSWV